MEQRPYHPTDPRRSSRDALGVDGSGDVNSIPSIELYEPSPTSSRRNSLESYASSTRPLNQKSSTTGSPRRNIQHRLSTLIPNIYPQSWRSSSDSPPAESSPIFGTPFTEGRLSISRSKKDEKAQIDETQEEEEDNNSANESIGTAGAGSTNQKLSIPLLSTAMSSTNSLTSSVLAPHGNLDSFNVAIGHTPAEANKEWFPLKEDEKAGSSVENSPVPHSPVSFAPQDDGIPLQDLTQDEIDVESGLKAPPRMIRQPSGAQQISKALQQLSARVNGHDDQDDRLSTYSSAVDSSFLESSVSHTQPSQMSDVEVLQEPDDDSDTPIQEVHFVDDETSKIPPRQPNRTTERHRLFGNSLGLFPPTSKIRLKCLEIISQKWMDTTLLVLLNVQVIVLSYQQWNPMLSRRGYTFNQGYTWVDWLLFAIQIFYTVEIAMKIIVWGLFNDREMMKVMRVEAKPSKLSEFLARWHVPWRKKLYNLIGLSDQTPQVRHSVTKVDLLESPVPESQVNRAFLRKSWNRIDFISSVSFWISFFMSLSRYDLDNKVMLFRALMCLRILRLTNLTFGTSTVLKALKHALPDLVDVSLFLICFWLLFTIIGIQSFKSSLRRTCVWTNPDDASDTYDMSMQFCGSYINATTQQAMPFVYEDGSFGERIKGYRCPPNSKCVSSENPFGGTVSFDNLFNSFQQVFVVLSVNTFSNLMYWTMDSDTIASSLFFIFSTFILTVWLLNLFIAVIVNAFDLVNEEDSEPQTRLWDKLSARLNRDSYEEVKKRSKPLRIYHDVEWVFVILIFVDLVVQATRTSESSEEKIAVIENFESGVTLVLLAEVVVRFACCLPHWRAFFRSKRNHVDLYLALITSIIIIPPVKSGLGIAFYWMSCFQLLRVYRFIMLVKFLRSLWLRVLAHVKTIYNLSLFYFILLYLTSVIMSRFFEGLIPVEELDDISFSMYTLPNVFLSLYTITSTENWSEIMYQSTQYAPNLATRIFAPSLLVLWFIFSNFVVLNIFIAVIAGALKVSEVDKKKEQIRHFVSDLRKKDPERGIYNVVKDRLTNPHPAYRHMESGNSRRELLIALSQNKHNIYLEVEQDTFAPRKSKSGKSVWNSFASKVPLAEPVWRFFKENPFLKIGSGKRNGSRKNFFQSFPQTAETKTIELSSVAREALKSEKLVAQAQTDFLENNPRFNVVLYMLPPSHRLRRAAQRIVPSAYGKRINGVESNRVVSDAFELTMFIATLAIVIIACYTTPLYRKTHRLFGETWNWVIYADVSFSLLFTLELIVRVVADGLLLTPNAYLRTSWNIIDTIVLLTLWINVIADLKDDGYLSSIVGAFKALRALRLLTVSRTARETFHNTIITGAWNIAGATVLSLTLLIPFSVWGLNIFNGRLGDCLDGSSYEQNCINEFSGQVFKWEILSPNVYTQPNLNFNSFFTSFRTLFEIVSLEGWTDLLLSVMNSTGRHSPPEQFASPQNGIFVVMFNFISMVFILTLFVSVIITNYSKTTGRAYLRKEQIAWYEVKKILQQVRASRHYNPDEMSGLQKLCHKAAVEKTSRWGTVVNVCLLIHAIGLMVECYPSPEGLETFRYSVYLICSSVFMVTLLMNVIARGLRDFVSRRWNLFASFVITGSFTTTVASYFVSRTSGFANVNKLFLVMMLFFVIPRSDRLSQLLKFASASLPSLFSLLYTWAVLFLVYAIAMNQIFGLTKLGENTTGNINMRTVTKSLILLFRMSFGEAWNDIMDDFTVEQPFCTNPGGNFESDCGNLVYAYVLFMTWNIVSMYIFLNMFVSLIVDNFSYIYHSSDATCLIMRSETRRFKECWRQFDPMGSGHINPDDLPRLLRLLDGPFSVKVYDGRFTINQLRKDLFVDNGGDPYSSNYNLDEVNSVLDTIDVKKVIEKRQKYQRFIQEALITMHLKKRKSLAFTDILLQLGLYARFNDTECLTLNDFVYRRILITSRVDRALKEAKVLDTLKTVICRWRYRKGHIGELRQNMKGPHPSTILPTFVIAEFLPDDDNNHENPFVGDEENPFLSDHDNARINDDEKYSLSSLHSRSRTSSVDLQRRL